MGLKRQAAAPIYQSNCFVGSTDDPTPYQIRLFGPSGVQLGNTISGSLTAYQVVRYLDVFAAAGLPAGDYSNVTAEFRADPSPAAALVSFCTVQESTFFSADFCMALPAETMDATRQRQLAINTANSYVVDALTMTRYDLGIRHPDHVRCWLTSGWGAVGIRVIAPDGNFVAGGDAITDTGTFDTGDRSLYNGFSNYWHMDIYQQGPTMQDSFRSYFLSTVRRAMECLSTPSQCACRTSFNPAYARQT